MNIGDIAIIPFTLAITQAIKDLFGVEGKANKIVALAVATVLVALSSIIKQELVTPEVAMWIKLVVVSVGGGLSAIGAFDYVREELTFKD